MMNILNSSLIGICVLVTPFHPHTFPNNITTMLLSINFSIFPFVFRVGVEEMETSAFRVQMTKKRILTLFPNLKH